MSAGPALSPDLCLVSPALPNRSPTCPPAPALGWPFSPVSLPPGQGLSVQAHTPVTAPPTHARTLTHTRAHGHSHVHVHSHTWALVHAHSRTKMLMHITHTCVLTCTHTHLPTHLSGLCPKLGLSGKEPTGHPSTPGGGQPSTALVPRSSSKLPLFQVACPIHCHSPRAQPGAQHTEGDQKVFTE